MHNNYQSEFRSINKQKGWTMWSLMFVIGTIMLFAYIGMQLVPVYSANNAVTNAMNQTVDDLDLYKATRAAVIRKVNDQLYLDGKDELLNYKTDLTVKRTKSNFVLTTAYNREIPLFFNISMLVKFNNVVERDLSR